MDNEDLSRPSASSPSSSPTEGNSVPREDINSSPNQKPGAAQVLVKDPSIWDIYWPRDSSGHLDTVYISGFPQIVLFWPILLTTLLCASLQGFFAVDSAVLGWITLSVVFFNLLVLVDDFDQKKFLITLLAVVVAVLGIWIVNLYGFSFIRDFAAWILSFKPALSTDAYLVLAGIVAGLFCWGMIVPVFSYWRLQSNEFLHCTLPVGRDMSIARHGCTVSREVPDVLESLLLFGGGNLVIKRDNQVLATIAGVPFLSRRMKAIEHLLADTRVVIER